MEQSPHPPSSSSSNALPRLRVAGKFFREGAAHRAFFARAVTWGPFPEEPADVAGELRAIREDLGANALRLYELPDEAFLDACAAAGLRCFVTIPWTQHVDFLADGAVFSGALKTIGVAVRAFRGHPAVAGYFVANEIPSTLVRWMGPARVRRALERLIEAGQAADPDALFSYANYPSTEYLLPGNQDFVSFNVYLENRGDYGRYVRRLQNLAGDKPLVMAEFGLDSRSHGDEAQAETLAWHLEETAAAGAAGTMLFAWSDRWARGGSEVTGWDFGLTRRDGSRKPAFDRVAETWRGWDSPADAVAVADGEKQPRFSVIVCTHRGSRTLRACLASLETLRYVNFETILVNDGSDREVEAIAGNFHGVRHVGMPHEGLSAARNRGAALATGEIFVYTDDDCEADPDWLTWLAAGFARPEGFAAMGGPNIPPRPETFEQACVEAAPGGPAHVLLSDTEAEHVPGCNLAVRREAFEAIGGFDARFWTAGDDVDFCWRLEEAGYRIGFSAPAMVWHHRRFRFSAYLKQQSGYGRAEALLIPVHPRRFGAMGGARWKGCVYGPASAPVPDSFTRIYQGVFGYAPYQVLYGGGDSGAGHVVSGVHWIAMTAGLGVLGWFFPVLGLVAAGMAAATVGHAARTARRATIDAAHDSWRARLCVGILALAQPPVRSFRRLAGSLPHARLPQDLAPSPRPFFLPQLRRLRRRRLYKFWSEEGETRDTLLRDFLVHCRDARVPARVGHGWDESDVQLPVSALWSLNLTTVTEYHAGENRLTRVRIDGTPTVLTAAIRIAVLGAALLLWKTGGGGWAAWSFLAAAFAAPEAMRLAWFARIARVLRTTAAVAGMSEVE